MTTFAPVWISTDEQLDRLQRAVANASLTTRLLGTYALPEGTAHLRGFFMPWMRMPVVLVSAGRATLTGSRFSFTAEPFRAFGWSVQNVRDDVAFAVNLASATIEPADVRSPFARLFDIPFTRVRTEEPGLAGNFLVCVGGRVSMPRIRSRSLELRTALMAAGANHAAR